MVQGPSDAGGYRRAATDRAVTESQLPAQVWLMSPTGEVQWRNDVGLAPGVLHPDDAEPVLNALRTALADGRPYERQIRMRGPDGAFHWAHAQVWPVPGAAGTIEHWVALVSDIEERARRESLQAAVGTADSPFGLTLLDLELRYLRVSLPLVALMGGEPDDVLGRRLADLSPELWEQVRPVYDRILADQKPTVFEMAGPDERWYRLLLYYPARVGDELIGIGIIDVDITDRKHAELAAARLAEERRELLQALVQTQERERRRLAADIHGDTLQVLGALRLKLDALAEHLSDREGQDVLADLSTTLDLATERLRTLLFQLWPPRLEHTGLAETLSELLTRSDRGTGVRTSLTVDLPDEPPLELSAVVYRVVAEAVTNAFRHAHAHTLDVELAEREGTLAVRVRDDGVGFDPTAAPLGHVGLLEMAERIQATGGSIVIDSTPGAGTTIQASVPCQPSSAASASSPS